jgi:hypothetical protein
VRGCLVVVAPEDIERHHFPRSIRSGDYWTDARETLAQLGIPSSDMQLLMLCSDDEGPPAAVEPADGDATATTSAPRTDDGPLDAAVVIDAVSGAAIDGRRVYLGESILALPEVVSRFLGTDAEIFDLDCRMLSDPSPAYALTREYVFSMVDRAAEWFTSPRAEPPLPFVVPGPVARRSRILDLYLRTVLRDGSIRPYAAMVAFLRRSRVTGGTSPSAAEEAAGRLSEAIRHWVDQRLWSLNRVPELVVHDDRHVERVDHFATTLAAALPRTKLDVEELVALSTAAWLHDWGHVGGVLNQHLIEDPEGVRHTHGFLSREMLLHPFYDQLHGLPRGFATDLAAVLCAHHQGWTSFDSAPASDLGHAAVGYCRDIGYEPPSLAKEIADLGLGARTQLERVQLLLAILRVADAADVGRHRVPELARSDLATATSRSNAKTQFLESSLRNLALRLQLAPGGGPAKSRGTSVANDPVPIRVAAPEAGTSDELSRYADFITAQEKHYLKHFHVEFVSLECSPSDGETVDFVARVTPAPYLDTQERQMAVDMVREDIRSEVRKVASTLTKNGLYFMGAVESEGASTTPA